MNSASEDPALHSSSLARRLTLLITTSAFGLLLAAALFLNWELASNLQRDAEDRLRHKVQVLERLIAESPPNVQGIRQEAHEEAEVSSESEFPFFLRVLDQAGREIVASDGMLQHLPLEAFAGIENAVPQRWQQHEDSRFLLTATSVTAGSGERWTIHVAFDVTAMTRFLTHFRSDVILMLMAGLVAATGLGAWVVNRGLRPLHEIAAQMEHVSASELDRRIATRRWPVELRAVASAFDRMLDRLQESFVRLQRFSADLAHELRTPINNLMGEGQVTLSRSRSAGEYERVLQSSLEELSRLAQMIDAMLFLAQADQARMAVELRPLSAGNELRAVVDFYQALADEQGIEVRIEGDASIDADPMLLRRALSNLLSNALRHTARPGSVELRARRDAQRTLIDVRDNGAGIPAEHHARLGDRFFRVDQSRSSGISGSGLGLAIVRSIMALHGGAMRIASEAGQGTTVTLEFPTDSGA